MHKLWENVANFLNFKNSPNFCVLDEYKLTKKAKKQSGDNFMGHPVDIQMIKYYNTTLSPCPGTWWCAATSRTSQSPTS